MPNSNLPIKLYVDILENDLSSGVTTTYKCAIYNIHKINELRKTLTGSTISIKDEGTIVRAGRYICMKFYSPTELRMIFYDVIQNPKLNEIVHKSLSTFGAESLSLLAEISSYIKDNYEIVSNEVVLIKGVPSWISIDK